MVCHSDGGGLSARSMGDAEDQPIVSVHFHDLLYLVLVVTVSDFQIDMGEYFQAACTGTLLSPSLVLTAASCTALDDYSDHSRGSTVVYQRPGQVLHAVRTIVHPEYSRQKLFNVAIVVVERSSVAYFPSIPRAPERFTNDRLKSCALSGYGKPGKPNVANFQTISLNDTVAQLISCSGPRTEHVCIHFRDLMPCVGDMGSTITCGDTLVALYTPAVEPGKKDSCTNRYGAVFTPLSAVWPWVKAVLETPQDHLAWINNPWYMLLLSMVVLCVTGAIYHGLVELMQRKYLSRFEAATPVTSATSQSSGHNSPPVSVSRASTEGSDHSGSTARTRVKPLSVQPSE